MENPIFSVDQSHDFAAKFRAKLVNITRASHMTMEAPIEMIFDGMIWDDIEHS